LDEDGQMMTDSMVTENTARLQIDKIKGHWRDFWFELKDFHDNRRWLDLGYTAFEECVEKELSFTRQRAYQLIAAANVYAELRCQDVLTVDQMKAGHAEVLTRLTPEDRLKVAESVDFGTTTIRQLREAVHELRTEPPSTVVVVPPPPMPALARPQNPVGIEIAVADATALPLPDGAVHLIVTAPPCRLDKRYRGISNPADGWVQYVTDFAHEAYRVVANGGRLVLNVPVDTTQPTERPIYASLVIAGVNAGFCYKFTIPWVARRSGRSWPDPDNLTFGGLITVFVKGDWDYKHIGVRRISTARFLTSLKSPWSFYDDQSPSDADRAGSPDDLFARVIETFSSSREVVVDPFLGMGATAIAAYRSYRRYVGFDMSPERVADCRPRLAAEVTSNPR
jgi:site-specific DNA-methyltransferase (adenine-specific)